MRANPSPARSRAPGPAGRPGRRRWWSGYHGPPGVLGGHVHARSCVYNGSSPIGPAAYRGVRRGPPAPGRRARLAAHGAVVTARGALAGAGAGRRGRASGCRATRRRRTGRRPCTSPGSSRPAAPIVAASARSPVEGLPPVPELYFWALQASFHDGAGRRHGGAHLGLQWHAPHPGSRAVNWGGYAPAAASCPAPSRRCPAAAPTPTPGTTGGSRRAPPAHDRAGGGGGWAGSVDGTHVRTLAAGGDRLDGLMVWSEVFARCDDPPVAVRWSGLTGTLATDGVVRRRSPCGSTTRPQPGRLRQHDGRSPTATGCARSPTRRGRCRPAPASPRLTGGGRADGLDQARRASR